MLNAIGIIIIVVCAVVVGYSSGTLERRTIQREVCPYCSCCKNCAIGCGVTPALPEDELVPMACYR